MTADELVREAERALFDHYGLAYREHTVALDEPSVRVRVLEFGDRDGPPVVLLHGIASATAAAAPLLPYLASGRRVLAVDWPGHGLSGPVRLRPGSIRAHAVAVLDGLTARLDLDRYDLVGHSMGAQFAVYQALHAPERIRRLVLLGAPGAGFAGVTPVPAMRVLSVAGVGPAVLRLPLSRAAFVKTNESMLGRGALDGHPPEIVDAGWRIGRRSANAAGIASFFHALITPRRVRDGVAVPAAELARLAMPTLLVWGDADVFMTPAAAGASIDAIPDHRLVTVPGAGHAPWLDAPEVCGEAVKSFLDSP